MVGTTTQNADGKCPVCGGHGYFRRDVPWSHRDFGRAIPCVCTLERIAEAERTNAARRKSKQVAQRASTRKADRMPAFKRSPEELSEFSYSRLTTFEQCPRRFMLRYLAGENTDPAGAREPAIGSAVHSTLQAFMREDPDGRTLAVLESRFDEYWDRYWRKLRPAKGEKEQWRLTVWQSLSRFYDAGNCGGRPRDLEKYFSFQLDESITIMGSADRIDNVGERDYQLIDYKALEPPFTEREALRDLQTVLYYFGGKSLYEGHPPSKISYLFVHHGTAVSVNPTPGEMEEGLDGVRALIQQIHSHKEFAPQRNQFCRNCVEYLKCAATRPE